MLSMRKSLWMLGALIQETPLLNDHRYFTLSTLRRSTEVSVQEQRIGQNIRDRAGTKAVRGLDSITLSFFIVT